MKIIVRHQKWAEVQTDEYTNAGDRSQPGAGGRAGHFFFTKKNAAAAMDSLKKDCGVEGCASSFPPATAWRSGSALRRTGRVPCWRSSAGSRRWIPRNSGSTLWNAGGEEAVDHLFHLACGLKSMILAEDQILTQVGDAPGPGQRILYDGQRAGGAVPESGDGGQAGQDRRGVQPGQRDCHGPGGGDAEEPGFDLKGKRCMGHRQRGRWAGWRL